MDIRFLQLPSEQLRRIPEPFRALVFGSSYVTNEVLFLTRVFILCLNGSEVVLGQPFLSQFAATQLGIVNRILCSKIYEYIRFVADSNGELRRHKTALAERLMKEVLSPISRLRKLRGYAIAEKVRNSAAHHYSLRDFRAFAVRPQSEASGIGLADMEGNSLYAFAEELVNQGLFSNGKEGLQDLEEIIEWVRESSRVIASVNNNLLIAMLGEFLPDINVEDMKVEIPVELMADLNKSVLPMLWRPFNAMAG